MKDIVHILNGDSTKFGLKEGGISGNIVVWREMLVEGPLDADVGSAIFWNKRASFFENELEVTKESYSKKVVNEISKISSLNTKEYVLWFEYDLFCQINLLALYALLLKNYNEKIHYSLICVGNIPGYKGLTSLGHVHPKDYPGLFERRFRLSKQDLIAAKTSWELFVNGSIEELINTPEIPAFEYLKMAILQFQKTIPTNNGLNQIDKQLLTCIAEDAHSEPQIIGKMLKWQQTETVYGYGDLQYLFALKKLSPYIKIANELYYLNEKGVAKINGV